jgi:hypothetical protein
MQNIDFTPLENIANKHDASQVAEAPHEKHRGLIVTCTVALVIAAVVFNKLLLIWFIGMAGVGVFFLSQERSYWKQQAALEEFKRRNNWSSGETMPLNAGYSNLGYVMQPATLQGNLDGHRFWLYTAIPQAGASNRQNLQPVTLLTIEFGRSLPTLLLYPANSLLSPVINKMAREEFRLEPLHLEGDFNTVIQSYYREGEQIDTLSYLTPDVMEVVQHKVKDIVLYNDRCVSLGLSHQGLSMAAGLPTAFESAQLLIKEIDQKA